MELQDDSSGSSTTPSQILSAPDGPPVLPQLLPLTDDMQPLLPDHGALAPSLFSAMRLTLDDLEFENEPFQQFSNKSQVRLSASLCLNPLWSDSQCRWHFAVAL